MSPRPAALTRRVGDKAHGLRRRVLTGLLSMPPVRRRLRQRAQEAWRGSGPIAFVCLGNICRSPFAAALARARLGPHAVVFSAGTLDRPGRPSPELAVAAARRWSVDLSDHRSRTADAALVETANQLFVFDADNLVTLLRAFPEARGRIHLLGALGDGPLSVQDPWGRRPEDYEAVYSRIAELIAETR